MKKIVVLVVVLCAVMVSSSVSAADWVWLYSDEYRTIYVDNNSIRRDYNYRGYIFRAFVKCIYSESGRNRVIENYRLRGEPLPRGIYNLSYEIIFQYFKEENELKYFCPMTSVCYTSEGNSIPSMSYSNEYFDWSIVEPDSIGEWIFDMVRARVPN